MTFSKKLSKALIVIFLFSLTAVAWTQRWAIYDAYRLRGYTPPAPVVSLATQTTMNDKTKRLFYVYRPSLEDKEAFNAHCRSSELTIVLGCYVSHSGIYLYNITDERINGVQQVTAAHEVLHAAYDRLSESDKSKLNVLLEEEFSRVKDQRIRSTIEDYRKKGADVNNELHSILGTEVRILSPELEDYYKKYFTDRSQVVSFSEKYEQAFSERKAKAAEYLRQMDEIKTKLDGLKNAINDQEARLASERSSLQVDRNGTNTPESARAFNARVDAYNAQVSAYQQDIKLFNGLVAQYNDLLSRYNNLAHEEGELLNAIDSRPSTIEAQ